MRQLNKTKHLDLKLPLLDRNTQFEIINYE